MADTVNKIKFTTVKKLHIQVVISTPPKENLKNHILTVLKTAAFDTPKIGWN